MDPGGGVGGAGEEGLQVADVDAQADSVDIQIEMPYDS